VDFDDRDRLRRSPGLRTRLVASLAMAAPLLALLGGCPDSTGPRTPEIAPTASSTRTAASWGDTAEAVVVELEGVIAAVASNDKDAAIERYKQAYWVCYDPDLEPASRTNLPEEMLDKRLADVARVREDVFSEIQSAVKHGAPLSQVEPLVRGLEEKIRGDAKKLDAMKVPLPGRKPQ
jgi:hypothetical protein